MYAPRQHRQEKKKPNANFLGQEAEEMNGPIMAPPVFSETGQSVPNDEESESGSSKAVTNGNNAAAEGNSEGQDQDGKSSESTSVKQGNKKQIGRSENPPQFKLKASGPKQLKFAAAPLQMKAGASNSSGGGANTLPDDVKAKMEGAMGANFDNVKITANSNKAKEVGALAFAQGNDIHFAPGQFNPSSKGGQELIGHELAHVVQQRQGRVQANAEVNGAAVNNDTRLEAEADALGAKAAQMKVDASSSKASASNAAAIDQPKQLAVDPNAVSQDSEEKDKDEEKQALGPEYSVTGTSSEGEANENENAEEAKANGEVVEGQDGVQDQSLQEHPNDNGQIPANVTEADNPEANTTSAENENTETKESESDKSETEDKEPENESEKVTAEEGASEGTEEGVLGDEASANESQNAADQGGGDNPSPDAEASAKTAAQNSDAENGSNPADAGLDAGLSGGMKVQAPQMGDFGASEPVPQLVAMTKEKATEMGNAQIVMDNGNGVVVVSGQMGAMDTGEGGKDAGNAAPIQMAPDGKNGKENNKQIEKIPTNITKNIFGINTTAANDLVDTFRKENEAKVATLQTLSQSIAPTIQGKADAAKGVIEASVNTNRTAIATDIAAKKASAQAEATRMEGVLQAQYDAIVTRIKAKTTAEKGRLQSAFDESEKTIAELEKSAIKSANDAFDSAEKDARALGTKECEKVDTRVNAYISNFSDPEEKVRKAVADAARDVGKTFKEKIKESADGAANEVPKGKANYLQGISAKIAEARQKTKANFDAGIKGLEASEKGSLESAKATLKAQKEAVKATLDATIKGLDQQQTNQVKAVEDAGIAAVDNADKTAKDSIKGLQEQLQKSIEAVQTQINETVERASNQKNPDQIALQKLLNSISASIDKSIEGTQTSIKTGTDSATKALTDQGSTADKTLIDMAANSANMSQEQLNGQIKSNGEVEKTAQKAFDDVAKKHDEDAAKAVDTAKSEMDKVVKDTTEGFTKAETGLKEQFKKKLDDLGKDIQAITKDLDKELKKNCDEAAEKAREPWWKTALKWIVTVVIMIVATALIIAFCPFTLGGLLLAFAIGAVAGILTLALTDLIDGKLSSFQDYVLAGIKGGIGGVFTLLGGKLGEMAAGYLTQFVTGKVATFLLDLGANVVVGTFIDTVGNGITQIAENLYLGKEVSWDVFISTMEKNVFNNFLGNLGGSLLGAWIGKTKIGKKIADWTGKTAEKEAKELAEKSARELMEKESKEAAEKAAKELAEKEAKELAEKEAKEAAEKAAKEAAEKEAKEAAEKAAKEAAEKEAKEAAEKAAKEAAEKAAKEAAEKEAKEAAEKAAKEAAEKAEKEAAEKAAREAAEKAAREAAEREAKEAAEKAAKEAAEKAEREAAEKAAKEAAEKAEKEAAEKAAKEAAEKEAKEAAENQAKNETKNTAEEVAEKETKDVTKKSGEELAADLKYPKAPDGYHWANVNGKPVIKRNPGKGPIAGDKALIELQWDPKAKVFKDLETGKVFKDPAEVNAYNSGAVTGKNQTVISNSPNNTFKGKSFDDIEKEFIDQGFTKAGPDPKSGKGQYIDPVSGKKYYFDKGGQYADGLEPAHIDVILPGGGKEKHLLNGDIWIPN